MPASQVGAAILLGEHDEASEGVGDAYRLFVARARQHWLAALQKTSVSD